jgi:hypothetical protein
MRFRHIFMGLGSAVVLASLFLTDPDQGIATGMLVLALVTPLLAVAFAHLARRSLFDYLDLEEVAERAKGSPTGSGLIFVGVCIVIAALLGLFGRSANAAVPSRALEHLPTLASEIERYWPNVPQREYFGGLIEHESCITLKHSRCWAPTSRLKSEREEGAGLGQLTRAWRADGSLRFDVLTEMRQRHPGLRELDWSNIYRRPDLQMRAVVLKVRGDFAALYSAGDRLARLAFADAAYNGGLGGLQRERRACSVKPGCDSQQWFGHVENTCLKSRAPLYGGRSACDINRHHVADVLRVRAPKYRGLI